MRDRQQHLQEVRSFLQKHFSASHWEFNLPSGWGNETYFAHGNGQRYFVKLGAPLANYQVMAALGFTPALLATGMLEDGTTLLVQPYIDGRKPSPPDFRSYLVQVASIINQMHHSPEVKAVLSEATSDQYDTVGLEALAHVQRRWEQYKTMVPAVAAWVDQSLVYLEQQVELFQGADLVASHNDICNANWFITSNDKIYLIDLDAMSFDDPAFDVGAILWWYYSPELRQRFLDIAGYPNDVWFKNRMQVRMAIHCLSIILPRNNSFDKFDQDNFGQSLTDFRAILAGRENPQGYA